MTSSSCLDFIFPSEHIVNFRQIVGAWDQTVDLAGWCKTLLQMGFFA